MLWEWMAKGFGFGLGLIGLVVVLGGFMAILVEALDRD